MQKHFYIMFFFCLGYISTSLAQNKMQVLTRITEQTFVYKRDFVLEVDAEKANVKVIQGKTDEVKVKLKQTVKNQDLKLAESHLDGHQYIFKDERSHLYLRNYILFNGTQEETTSLFTSEYEIIVPENCHVKIKNKLGDVELVGLNGSIKLEIEYGKVQLDGCNGKLEANMNIGDLNIKNSFLDMNAETHNVVMHVISSGGQYDIASSFGALSFVLTDSTNGVFIKSDNTDLTFINKNNLVFNFEVKNRSGLINVIGGEEVTQQGDYSILKTNITNAIGEIGINAAYGDISIY